jgi:hypothetical protein
LVILHISRYYGPALGDVRALGAGDTVRLLNEARKRPDWSRYVDAIAHAVSRGAEVRWLQ